MRPILVLMLLCLGADGAFAQTAAPAVDAATPWSNIITTTLQQLLTAAGFGSLATLVPIFWQGAMAIRAFRQKLEADNAEQSTNSLFTDHIRAALGERLKDGALSLPDTKGLRSIKSDIKAAIVAAGGKMDSDDIETKVKSLLPQIAMQLQSLRSNTTNPPSQ